MPGLPPVEVPGCHPACEHEWGEELPGFHPGQVPQTIKGGVDDGVASAGNKGGQSCQKCGGWRGCLGLEPDVLAYVGHLVLICRALRRVLRDDGTFWLNLGDSYCGGGGYYPDAPSNTAEAKKARGVGNANHEGRNIKGRTRRIDGLKAKDLIGVPDRVRFALQADGWYVRSAIVWAKGLSFLDDYAGSVMPESVRDRPTSAYEMVYLLTKEARYFYDSEAVKEEAIMTPQRRLKTSAVRVDIPGQPDHNGSRRYRSVPERENSTRNLRNVWAIPEQVMRLRDDIPPEQRAEIIHELTRRGLI